ncbi:MAG: hypothetical protein II655_08320 [Thermoguttaceae bacterium]|nr:hypothetical protein [Thermoguttaceae bacterium]
MYNKEMWDAYDKISDKWDEIQEQWRTRNGFEDGKRIALFTGSSDEWPVESIKDVQLLLSYGWEFSVNFRGVEYFITPDPWFKIWGGWDVPLYESLDLDDFGENARIGRNGEFYLKDVIGELEF